jgi:hypothetical protein
MSIDRSALRDTMRGHGTDLVSAKNDTALDALFDATARLTQLLDSGRIPPVFVSRLAEWVEQTADSAEAGQPGPSINNVGNTTAIKPEYQRIIRALDRGELRLDPTTGLPETADSNADVDNVLTALERQLKTTRISGDDNNDRLRRILDDAKKLGKTVTDQLGEVAEALGLQKDADKADVIKMAKDATSKNEKLGDIAVALGLDKAATPDQIIAAAKAAKATTGRRRVRIGG